jgi:hypothetical protein
MDEGQAGNAGNGAGGDGNTAGGGNADGGSADDGNAKASRSRRRRLRRNEAKRLAKASSADPASAAQDGGADGPKGPAGAASGQGPAAADGRRPRPEGQQGQQGHGDGRRKKQGQDGGRRQDNKGRQADRPRGDQQPGRGQGGDRKRDGSRGGEGPRGGESPRGGEGQRRGQHEGRRQPGQGGQHDRPYARENRDRDNFARQGDKRRRPEGAPRPFPSDSIIPPPEVIAALEGGNYAPPARHGRGGSHGPQAPAVRVLETLAPSSESLAVLAALETAIEEAAPLQAKHRAGLKGDIRALWEELTSERESRSADYLGTPPALSAYLRYFLPWNVFRASAIFSNADFCLPDKAVVIDIGSGPLTLPIALYAARPELRDVPLTFYCVDRVERVLEAGLAIFETLCMRVEGRLPPWRIELRKEGFGAPIPERAHLLAAANVFNEFFWKDKGSLGERALDTARTLLSYLRENGSLFVMEPGDPRSGAFITALRAALAAEGAYPLGPCPHSLSCPMPGIYRHLLPPEETRTVKGDPNAAPSRYVLPAVTMPKKRDKFPWCHFGVDTDKAPAWLQDLSAEAGLPKERAVMSWLWAARGAMVRPVAGMPDLHNNSEKERRARVGRGILVRVVSEPFTLPEGWTGQYACSSLGYTLLRRSRSEQPFEPGDLLEVTTSPLARNDEKSGAIILPT